MFALTVLFNIVVSYRRSFPDLKMLLCIAALRDQGKNPFKVYGSINLVVFTSPN